METGKEQRRPTVEDVLIATDRTLSLSEETKDRVNDLLQRIGEGRPLEKKQRDEGITNPVVVMTNAVKYTDQNLHEINDMIMVLENWIGFSKSV